jgi:hypothetical protein
MTTQTIARPDLVARLESDLNALAIGQFASDEFKLFFGTPLTLERARFVALQMMFYNHNRREGWAYVQAKAPWDVKRAIWQHEQDELFHDPRAGSDHRALTSNQAIALGVSPDDVARARATPLVEAVLAGFNYLNASEPWLGALTGAHFLERRNNGNIIPGGAMSKRWRDKIVRELGVREDALISSNVHIAADIDHSDAIWDAVAGAMTDEHAYETAIRGGRAVARLDRAFRAALGHEMRTR